MKTIDKKEIQRLATTLMFNLDESELETVMDHTEGFLKNIDTLLAIDTTGVDPMFYPIEDVKSYLREDEVSHVASQADVLVNAPKKEGDYFEIVQVVEK